MLRICLYMPIEYLCPPVSFSHRVLDCEKKREKQIDYYRHYYIHTRMRNGKLSDLHSPSNSCLMPSRV